MSRETIEVLQPGFLTTVQDLGRYGYQSYGVPVSGAMDHFALRGGNALLGNDQGCAGLEMTVAGPTLGFLADVSIAVTGADMAPTTRGRRIPFWRPVSFRKGDVVSFGTCVDGVRCYLCVAGGVDVPEVLGSRSTYIKAAIGGLQGRALKQGDVISCLPVADGAEPAAGGADTSLVPMYGHELEIRVVLGPQHRAFTDEGVFTFLNSVYTVAAKSDRTGYRLDGPTIAHRAGADIVSDGSPLGAVQVPGDGKPIILLADRGTTGGYAKIATVVSADIGMLAQAGPGDAIAFKAVTLEEAEAARRDIEARLEALLAGAPSAAGRAPLSVSIEGKTYEVLDEWGRPLSGPLPDSGARTRTTGRATVKLDGRTFEFDVEVRRAP